MDQIKLIFKRKKNNYGLYSKNNFKQNSIKKKKKPYICMFKLFYQCLILLVYPSPLSYKSRADKYIDIILRVDSLHKESTSNFTPN